MDNLDLAFQEQDVGNFIGRGHELELFEQWLANPEAPRTLYIHDAVKEPDKKGGVGKSWLLRQYARMAQGIIADIAIVRVDFFNLTDRDRLFLAEKIVAGLQRLYPEWAPNTFKTVVNAYHALDKQMPGKVNARDSDDIKRREEVSAALLEDLQRLEAYRRKEPKMLLVFFDTFERIENNPDVAVLGQAQSFPDNYHFPFMRSVIAGRNEIDWSQDNWEGLEQDVQVLPLHPFSEEEMQIYVDTKSIQEIPAHSRQAHELYERTEGRPIILGLAIDVINNGILNLTELTSIPQADFERNLVPQINNLNNPINWVILFMAHVYHRFNTDIMNCILESVQNITEPPIEPVNAQELAVTLPELSFIRRASTGGDFVLHDEMRRLVTKYCWEVQDTDRRFRKSISRSIAAFYQREIEKSASQQQQQSYIVEALYHRLFVDLEDGLNYFKQQFAYVLRYAKTAFGRLLLSEAQKFNNAFSLKQRNDLLYLEVCLLRSEEDPAPALQIIQSLRETPDQQWLEENRSVLFMEEGRCYQQQGKLPEAANSYTQRLAIEQEQGHESDVAQLYNSLGYVFRRRGQYSIALDYYEKGITLYRKLNQPASYARLLSNLSYVYRLQGKLEEALRQGKIALRIRQTLFEAGLLSEIQVGSSLNTLGAIYLYMGNILEAEQRFQQTRDIYFNENFKAGLASVYNRLGQVQGFKGDTEGALAWYLKAQEIAQEVDVEQFAVSLNRQGRVYAQRHDEARAIDFFERAITITRGEPDYFQLTENLIDLATVSQQAGQSERAQQLLTEAEEISRQEQYLSRLSNIEQLRGQIAYAKGNYTTAFEHFIHACQFMAEFNENDYNRTVQNLVDAVLALPAEISQAVIKDMKAYWLQHDLDKSHPDLIRSLQELEELMII